MSPADAKNEIEALISRIKLAIDLNPGMNIDNIIF
jgi:hypothetical protein